VIQYGGSVEPDNAASFFTAQGVDGALIGGASLHADQFIAIVRAAINQAKSERNAAVPMEVVKS
jgi:triosephosphate isomerase